MADKMDCDKCAKEKSVLLDHSESEAECLACLPPLRVENYEHYRIYAITQSQFIMSVDGPVDLDINAIISVMKLHGVQDQRKCLDAVLKVG